MRWALALALLVATACRGDRRQVAIFDVTERGASELVLSVESCNAGPRATVEETAEQVVVTVTAGDSDGDDCADTAVVELDEPLGDRELIDGSTGEPAGDLGG